MTPHRTIMCMDMNAFFAAIEQVSNPALRGRPVLVGGSSEKRTVVAACSYEARPYGITSGMPMTEALRLCPDAVRVTGTPVKYAETSRRIFDMLKDYTPEIELFSIDEAFMDVTDTHRFFGGPESVAKRIKSRIRDRFGLTCSIGIGPNKLIAKLAAGIEKPDGLVRIDAEDVPRLLKYLPVEHLCGIGEKLKASLSRLGIVTCGDLAAASPAALRKKFGILGEVLRKMGEGTYQTPLVPYYLEPPAKSMGHSYTLEKDTFDPDFIKATLLRLSEQVGRRLRKDRFSGRTVYLGVRFADFSYFGRQKTVDAHFNDGYRIYLTALRILESVLPLKKKVRLVSVSVASLREGEYQPCFLPDWQKAEHLVRTMDKINDKWGEFTVTRASLLLRPPLRLKAQGLAHQRLVA